MLRLVFPFIKLLDEAPKGGQRNLSFLQRRWVMLTGLIAWTFAVFAIVYLFLALAARSTLETTPIQETESHLHVRWKAKHIEPAIGYQFPVVVTIKYIIQVFIFHYICGHLMEPVNEIWEARKTNLELMQPTGVIQFTLSMLRRVTCRQTPAYWLSAFVVDLLLLMVVGATGILHNLHQIISKTRMTSTILDCQGPSADGMFCVKSWEIWLQSLFGAYVAFLMFGFLFVTLFRNISPAPARRKEWCVWMNVLIVLWMLEFLVISISRSVYTGPWAHASSIERELAAGAQIFITHGGAMLGAIRLEHACHLKKCPDMTWSTFNLKFLPMLVGVGIFWAFTGWRRLVHDWALAHYSAYSWFATPWTYASLSVDCLGGLVFLMLAQEHTVTHTGDGGTSIQAGSDHDAALGDEDDNAGAVDFSELFDYDTTLIAITFSIAIFYNVAIIYMKQSQGFFWAMGGEICHLVAPVCMAMFTFSVWQCPPKRGTRSHWAVWFALLFTACQFINFQIIEDCHISSNLPACCSYPDLETEHLQDTCDKSSRCLIKGPFSCRGKTLHLYCANGGHCESGHGEEHGEEHGEDHGEDHGTRRLDDSEEGYGDCCCCHEEFREWWCHGLFFDKSPCPESRENVTRENFPAGCEVELQCRWSYFAAVGGATADIEHHRAHESASFLLFETLGMAATVEMYFTIMGILLKVIFLSQHPNSEKILTLHAHHHHLDHATGKSFVLAVSQADQERGRRRGSTHSSVPASFAVSHHTNRSTVELRSRPHTDAAPSAVSFAQSFTQDRITRFSGASVEAPLHTWE